ncbi:MAG: hypothetical protein ABSG52_16905 [Terriglobales bacterium]|jgi:hypothetical protein
MKKAWFLAVVLVQLGFTLGCAKPDTVTTLKSPTPGVFYTVETHYGHGPVSADFTRVYAHVERDGKTDKKLVLDGENLVITKAVWANPNEITLWVSGRTNTYRNEVTLIAGSWSLTIHNQLEEQR